MFLYQAVSVELLLILGHFTVSVFALPSPPSSQIDGLYYLYNSTDGDHWKYTTTTCAPPITKWNFVGSDVNPCDGWCGITCEGCSSSSVYCNITKIELPQMHLQGTLPQEVNLLTELTELKLPGPQNHLEGTDLSFACTIPNLKHFDLAETSINGTIPLCLWNSSTVNVLHLSENSLTGSIPANILSSSSPLEKIMLSSNSLHGVIPLELCQLSVLTYIDLSQNSLNGFLQTCLGDLVGMQYFALSRNFLHSRIPSEIGQMSVLSHLALSYNAFSSTIPTEFGLLLGLQYLYLSGTLLTGGLPEELGLLTGLMFADISVNLLLGGTMPASFGQLVQLSHLSLYFNDLHGTIPTELGALEALTSLYLHFNELSGTIPAGILQPSALSFLSLQNNTLTGPLPSPWSEALERVGLSNNFLSGEIPPAIGQLSAIRSIVLTDNDISGSLPAIIGDNAWLLLEHWLAESNMITGSLPATIGQAESLQYFSMNANYLTGTIPTSFGVLSALAYLYVNYNSLSGADVWSSISPATTDLDITHNLFSGPVPFNSEKYNFTNFYIRSNSFTGTLPADMSIFSQVVILDLSFNLFSGTLGTQLKAMPALVDFLITGNQLSGAVDEFFEGVASPLVGVDISANGFTGTLPNSLFTKARSSLVEFVAAQNCFTGTISDAVCDASKLGLLDLSGISGGDACSKRHYNWVYHYYTSRTMLGDIPPCLFNNSHLVKLSLNSNGIRSSLGDISPGSPLRNISMSNNRIFGSIPLSWKQNPGFLALDLSYNHISGDLSDAIWYSNSSIKNIATVSEGGVHLHLESNRLSGNIPDSFQSARYIDILQGNMFACSLDGSELPAQDPYKTFYSCGSQLLDGSMFAFLVTEALRLLVFAFIYLPNSKSKQTTVRANLGKAYGLLQGAVQTGHVEVDLLHTILGRYRYYLFLLLVLIWVIFVPLYLGVKSVPHWSTHLYQYGWVISMGFMEHLTPATTVFALCMVLIPALVVVDIKLNRTYRSNPAFIADREARNSVLPDVDRWNTINLSALIAANVIILGVVNGTYVYSELYMSSRLQTAMVMATSLFKIVWNLGVVNSVFRKLNGSKSLLVGINILNNIIIPVIGTVLVDIECYLKLFVPSHPVGDPVLVERYHCPITLGLENTTCVYTPLVLEHSTIPPFLYSGQCSNSLLTNYIPVYIVMYGIVHMGLLMLQFAAMCYFDGADKEEGSEGNVNAWRLKLLHKCKANLRWLRTASLGVISFSVLPIVASDDLTRFHAYNRKPMYNLKQLGTNWMVGMLLILTFGVAYPPLSIVLFAELALASLFQQVCIHKHLQQLQGDPDPERLKQWSKGMEIEMGQLMSILANPKPVTSFLIALFFFLFLYDMITSSGDHHGMASIFCGALVGWGFLVSVLYYYYEEKLRAKAMLLGKRARTMSTQALELVGVEKLGSGDESLEWPRQQQEVTNPIVNVNQIE